MESRGTQGVERTFLPNVPGTRWTGKAGNARGQSNCLMLVPQYFDNLPGSICSSSFHLTRQGLFFHLVFLGCNTVCAARFIDVFQLD